MGAIGSKDGLTSNDIISFFTLVTSLHDEVLIRKVSSDNAKKIINHQLSVFDKYRLHQNRQTDASIFDEPNIIKISGKYKNNDGKTAWVISLDCRPNSRSYKLLHGTPVSRDDSVRAGENSQSLTTPAPMPTQQGRQSRGRSLEPVDVPPQRDRQDNLRSNSSSNLRNQQLNHNHVHNNANRGNMQHNRVSASRQEQYSQPYQNNYTNQQQNYRRTSSVDRFSYPNERQINMMSDMPNYGPRYDEMPYGQSNDQPYGQQSYNPQYDPQRDIEEMPLGMQ